MFFEKYPQLFRAIYIPKELILDDCYNCINMEPLSSIVLLDFYKQQYINKPTLKYNCTTQAECCFCI